MNTNRVKEKLANSGVAIGITINWPNPGLAEFLGYLGFDCLVIDAEHGPVTDEQFEGVARAADVTGAAAIIRLPLNPPRFSRYLDIGAHGVQAPQISSFNEAQAVIDAVKFPPFGKRGLGRTRAARYGLLEGGLAGFPEVSNSETIIMIQIENLPGFEALPDILTLEALDVILVGPLDLSQSLGLTGQVDHPQVIEITDEIIRQTNSAGKTAALPAATAADIERGLKRGARYFLTAVSGFVMEKGCELLKAVPQQVKGR
jgi:4-hydroxy-2-oxoheptanedioate aldolase